jgi:type II secretory pathway pseudopilin PulG
VKLRFLELFPQPGVKDTNIRNRGEAFDVRRSGFTLIEALVVSAGLAALAAIAGQNSLESEVRAKVARVRSDTLSLANALEGYAVDHGNYPYQHDGSTGSCGLQLRSPYQALSTLTSPVAYTASISKDPFTPEDPEDSDWTGGSYHYWVKYTRVPWSYCMGWDVPPNDVAWRWLVGDENALAEWTLVSYGPDRELNWVSDVPSSLRYDPSNGTVSVGDIFRVGP